MGRFSISQSYDHKCLHIGDDTYSISWTVDRYYAGDRLRHPVRTRRITDEVCAQRFCKKHNVSVIVASDMQRFKQRPEKDNV